MPPTRQRTSDTFTTMRTSASSCAVEGSPGLGTSVARPTKRAPCPLASGVPTVTLAEDCAGGAHDPNERGGPWEEFGAKHSSCAGTSETSIGPAPLGLG